MKKVIALFALMTFNFGFIFAADAPVKIGDVEMPAIQSSAAFEQIKKKVGRWEGRLS